MRSCPRCKRAILDGATECAVCRATAGSAARPKPVTQKLAAPSRASPATPLQALPPPAPAAAPPHPAAPVVWLHAWVVPAIAVISGRQVTIGRTPESDLVLAHDSVSRRHAVVKSRGDQVLLADPGSANGTLLNGVRVTGLVRLQVGDRISIGPFDVDVSRTQEAPRTKSEQFKKADTREVSVFGQAEMTGQLGRLALAELLQFFELGSKTGTLQLETADGGRGKLVMVNGKPTEATLGADTGPGAVLKMLRLQSGRFAFSAVVERTGPPMSVTLSSLLMESARADDEFRRSREVHVDAEANAFFGMARPPSGDGERQSDTLVMQKARFVACPACKRQVMHARVCGLCGASLAPPSKKLAKPEGGAPPAR